MTKLIGMNKHISKKEANKIKVGQKVKVHWKDNDPTWLTIKKKYQDGKIHPIGDFETEESRNIFYDQISEIEKGEMGVNRQIEPLTKKQWEEIWKYFGFSKKRRIYDYTRQTMVVDPNGKSYDWDYPELTLDNIFEWIFPQLISWSIEKDNEGYLWAKMDLKTQTGRVYSQDYLDADSDIEDTIEMIGEMLFKMIR